MSKHWVLVLSLSLNSLAAEPTGQQILKAVDANITSDNKIIATKMIVRGRRSSRTIESLSYIAGTEKSYTEFASPPREAGTKMLKLGEQLWIYSPQTDRTLLISGHMLRQSVMGSDLSYEDMMEDPQLAPFYAADIVGEAIVADRSCWILALASKSQDVAYSSRKLWVDKERFIIMQEERFARSGVALKSLQVRQVQRQQGRWVATHLVFKDQLLAGEGTEFIITSLQLNAEIPDHIFTKSMLRK
ncbi:MAG: outer membrane lipoprotein-sorting protein [Calditrichaeota bacterium]|nr:MAG: outer membrane lipoprotein-sorting protein [Calditrichota bacterium]